MQMPWFKLFHEARTDPKLRALSRDQHYVWFNLLCYANEQAERGLIRTMDDEVLACAVADGDVALLQSALERLVKLQLIDRTAEGITPHGWAERQAKSDVSSAERSKRYRERHKASGEKPKSPSRVTQRDATRDERVTQRDVTVPSRESSRQDKDKDNTPYISPTNDDKKTESPSKPTPSQGELAVHRIESQPSRSPEDLADVRAAETLLASDLRTEPLAQRLAREHNLHANLKVAGWKWLRAAEKMVGPTVTDSQRKQFNYFATIAGNTTDDERSRPQRYGSSKPEPEKPTVYYRARRRTPEELARAYSGMGSIAS